MQTGLLLQLKHILLSLFVLLKRMLIGAGKAALWLLPRLLNGNSGDKLSTLPVEVLSEIIQQLEWLEVLRVRRTCKRLCAVSRSLPVWRGLLDRYRESRDMPIHLDEPVGYYSAEELEQLLLTRISASIGWESDHPTPARQRIIPDESIRCIHIVEGGRWLLAASLSGCVKQRTIISRKNPWKSSLRVHQIRRPLCCLSVWP
ncbi:hypothetical protein BDN72DRAFT_341107 [Pluteus cervinus]|uniref:Uncharacterized protein n=1 Tax=Pluteus cervinus TaxID=181527 RepID=A0ACD3ABL9_9AGAR|nr:hypothetical protein BDN72DRAFT_341107 [Pluteus cervinus]